QRQRHRLGGACAFGPLGHAFPPACILSRSTGMLFLSVATAVRLSHGAPSGNECRCAQPECDQGADNVTGSEQESRDNRHQHKRNIPFAPERRGFAGGRGHASTSLSFAARAAAASSATLDTMSSRDAPGWNTCRTPAFLSLRSSSSGTMPPITTGMCSSPAFFKAFMSFGTSRWSVASEEMPITSTSSSSARRSTWPISCHGGVYSTSMPASRRNAATTRLPRSCPSSPILVTSTLGGCVNLGGLIMPPGYGGTIYGEPRLVGWVKRGADPTPL